MWASLAFACFAMFSVHEARAATFESTSYGPPFVGIEGTGITATGFSLSGSPHVYGVAVDPRVIRLGSRLIIWPNPYRTRHTFVAFDTGGAIKGNRIDFYHPSRGVQLGWGRRQVQVYRAVVRTRASMTHVRVRHSTGWGHVHPR